MKKRYLWMLIVLTRLVADIPLLTGVNIFRSADGGSTVEVERMSGKFIDKNLRNTGRNRNDKTPTRT